MNIVHLLALLRDRRIKAKDITLFIVMLTRVDENAYCKWTLKELAEEMGCFRITLYFSIRRLLKANVIAHPQRLPVEYEDAENIYIVPHLAEKKGTNKGTQVTD